MGACCGYVSCKHTRKEDKCEFTHLRIGTYCSTYYRTRKTKEQDGTDSESPKKNSASCILRPDKTIPSLDFRTTSRAPVCIGRCAGIDILDITPPVGVKNSSSPFKIKKKIIRSSGSRPILWSGTTTELHTYALEHTAVPTKEHARPKSKTAQKANHP